jgi:malonate decarboxylase delta subunit
MSGMETLSFDFAGGRALAPFAPVLVGVVASGNLEILVEPGDAAGCRVGIDTSARGFGNTWEAVLRDFHERHALAGLAISINDMGATPAVVSLRLDQAMSALRAADGSVA